MWLPGIWIYIEISIPWRRSFCGLVNQHAAYALEVHVCVCAILIPGNLTTRSLSPAGSLFGFSASRSQLRQAGGET